MLACPQCTVFNNIAVIPNEQVEILRVYSRRLKKLNHAGHIQVINQKLSHKRLVVKPVDQKGDCAFDSIYISFGRVKEDRNMLVSGANVRKLIVGFMSTYHGDAWRTVLDLRSISKFNYLENKRTDMKTTDA